MRLQALVRALYPPQCLCCDAQVEQDFALCGTCWRETPFIAGLVCDICGAPLPGQEDAAPVACDDCLRVARPWSRGRAALIYGGNARHMILQLKHGDRLDLARPFGDWLARVAAPILQPGMVVAPVRRGRRAWANLPSGCRSICACWHPTRWAVLDIPIPKRLPLMVHRIEWIICAILLMFCA